MIIKEIVKRFGVKKSKILRGTLLITEDISVMRGDIFFIQVDRKKAIYTKNNNLNSFLVK